MQLYCKDEKFTLYQGSMLDMGEFIEPNSIDSIVTDPPYELNFMNKGWDNSGIAFQVDTWKKCFDVLKPGGHLLAFGGSRTFHRIACAIEDAGFEIRDTIMYLYGSGFPKSMNIGLALDRKNGVESEVVGLGKSGKPESHTRSLELKDRPIGGDYELKKARNEWNGWGTTLKPAYEPIIIARKPCEGTCLDNVLKYRVGGINIDECRIPTSDYLYNHGNSNGTVDSFSVGNFGKAIKGENASTELGRFPSNVILTYDETDKDEVIGGMPETVSNGGATTMPDFKDAGQKNSYNKVGFNDGDTADRMATDYVSPIDSGSAARYFYCAKASKRDRDEGLDGFALKQCTGGGGGIGDYLNDVNSCSGKFGSEKAPHFNHHPCVKPTDLMQYLIRLVTPKGGIVLDPFNGSGSTGKAAMFENNDRNSNYNYIGIEITPEYLPISEARIRYAISYKDIIPEKPISENKKKVINNQMNLFELPNS